MRVAGWLGRHWWLMSGLLVLLLLANQAISEGVGRLVGR